MGRDGCRTVHAERQTECWLLLGTGNVKQLYDATVWHCQVLLALCLPLSLPPCSFSATLCHPSHSVTPLTLSPLSLCHPSHSVTPLTLSPLSLCHPSHSVTPLTLSPLSLCHPSHSVTPLTLSPLSLCHPSHSVTPLTLSPLSLCHPSHSVTPSLTVTTVTLFTLCPTPLTLSLFLALSIPFHPLQPCSLCVNLSCSAHPLLPLSRFPPPSLAPVT